MKIGLMSKQEKLDLLAPYMHWIHHSRREYLVLHVTNKGAKENDPDYLPLTVVYVSVEDNQVWSRPVDEFLQKFRRVDQLSQSSGTPG